jgi:hypothetical protein
VIFGSLAGVAVLYELVSLADRGQLETHLHTASDVYIGAACLFVFGWGLALVAPKTARWFAMFIVAGAAAAGAIAAKGTEQAFAMPLFSLGLAAVLIVFASFRGERQEHNARVT